MAKMKYKNLPITLYEFLAFYQNTSKSKIPFAVCKWDGGENYRWLTDIFGDDLKDCPALDWYVGGVSLEDVTLSDNEDTVAQVIVLAETKDGALNYMECRATFDEIPENLIIFPSTSLI